MMRGYIIKKLRIFLKDKTYIKITVDHITLGNIKGIVRDNHHSRKLLVQS